MRPLKLILALLTFSLAIQAQSDVLEAYIRQGLADNESIKQQNFQLKKSLYALKEASGLFAPTIGLEASYTDARGGRSFDVPIGDILNPVYQNLNKINAALDPTASKFPTLNNVSEQFLPENFYDAYFQVSMPLINAEIWYNRSIKKDQIEMQQNEVAIYKRELVKDIKTAYFSYLKAQQAVSIYESALLLVKESERVNEKLVENGKEVIYAVSRAKSEVSKVEAQLNDAQNTRKNAAAYFNFLLNRPMDSEIIIDNALLSNAVLLPEDAAGNSSRREELNKLMLGRKINQSLLNVSNSSWIPKVGAQLDLGSQASDFAFNSSSRYYLVGVTFDWTLFKGLRDVNRVKQAQLDLQSVNAESRYSESQLQLAAATASNSYSSAKEQFKNAIEQEKSANEYFNLMNKKYREGQALYIEFLDARNETTLANLQKSITYFDSWIKHAELERANATYTINQ
jgi:outer membrane protein TolC